MIRLSLGHFAGCALYAAAIVFYTDYLTTESAGVVVSYGAVATVLLASVWNLRLGVLGALLLLFTFPAFPRDLLDLYAGLDLTGESLVFASPKFLTIGGLSLIIWMFVGLAVLAILRGFWTGFRFADPHVLRMVRIALCFVAALLLAATLNALTGAPIAPREILSDLRFPIMLALGAIIGAAFVSSCGGICAADEMLVRLLITITLISGFKVVFFVLDDRLSRSVLRLSFSNPFEITFTMLLALIWLGSKMRMSRRSAALLTLFGLIASVPDGRGPIFIDVVAFVSLFILAGLYRRSRLPSLVLRGSILLAGICLLLLAIAASDQRLWNFLAYKSDFLHDKAFYAEMDHSPAVRIAELKNIGTENAASGIGLLIGQGAGGSFTYKSYPLSTPLGRSDYTASELEHGLFYHPHLFITYWFLKGGGLAVCLYIGIFVWVAKQSAIWMRLSDDFSPVFMALLTPAAIFESFWQPDFTLALAILIAVFASRGLPNEEGSLGARAALGNGTPCPRLGAHGKYSSDQFLPE
jgi:hypothetical protein